MAKNRETREILTTINSLSFNALRFIDKQRFLWYLLRKGGKK